MNELDFSPLEQSSNWQHQLRLSSLYPWHIMMSALRQDYQKIFNQLPYFVAAFWISILSATTSTNFV